MNWLKTLWQSVFKPPVLTCPGCRKRQGALESIYYACISEDFDIDQTLQFVPEMAAKFIPEKQR